MGWFSLGRGTAGFRPRLQACAAMRRPRCSTIWGVLAFADLRRNIGVAYDEAQSKTYKLTWPVWRSDQRAAAALASKETTASSDKHNVDGKPIRGIVDAIVKSGPAKNVKVDVVAHSGGGSFIFG